MFFFRKCLVGVYLEVLCTATVAFAATRVVNSASNAVRSGASAIVFRSASKALVRRRTISVGSRSDSTIEAAML